MIFDEKMKDLHMRTTRVQNKIVVEARPLIAVLRDAGREHSAKALDALFFEYDALLSEVLDYVRDNPDGFINSIVKSMR